MSVDEGIYKIHQAYEDLFDIYWVKRNFKHDIGDLLYIYVTKPKTKIMYLYQVAGFASKVEVPPEQIKYWVNERDFHDYSGEFIVLSKINKVDRYELSRNYLIKKGFIEQKDRFQGRVSDSSKDIRVIEKYKKIFNHANSFFAISDGLNTYPDEVNVSNSKFPEGAKKTIVVNKYERNPEARAKCLQIYGSRCYVCTMSFEHTYGDFAKDFIHVHHVKPLHEIGEKYEVDPKEDLRPVCPNCHAMLHKIKDGESISIDDLKGYFKERLENPLRYKLKDL